MGAVGLSRDRRHRPNKPLTWANGDDRGGRPRGEAAFEDALRRTRPEFAGAHVPDRCDTPGVPTEIYFAGQNVRIKVDEAPSQVAEAFASAHGLPFRLTGHGGGGDVYVNPALVAFWSASDWDPQPEPTREPPQPTTKRESVTDIWGNPLGRKRRR
jgi:hypothetical protein